MSDSNTQPKEVSINAAAPVSPAPAPTKRLRSASKGSLADVLHDWTGLLAAVVAHGTDLGTLEPLRAGLQTLLDQGTSLSAQQDALTANSQVTTKQLQGVLLDGKKQASRLRAGIKSQFGYSDVKLVQFGTKPLRRHARTSKVPAPQTPAPVE